jgi:hypothetical protein
MFAQDHLFHTHEHKVLTDSQMSQIKYNYYINIISNGLKQLSRSRTAGGSIIDKKATRTTHSLELLVEEFHTNTIF